MSEVKMCQCHACSMGESFLPLTTVQAFRLLLASGPIVSVSAFVLKTLLSMCDTVTAFQAIIIHDPLLITSAKMLLPSGINWFWESGHGHTFCRSPLSLPQFHLASSKTLGENLPHLAYFTGGFRHPFILATYLSLCLCLPCHGFSSSSVSPLLSSTRTLSLDLGPLLSKMTSSPFLYINSICEDLSTVRCHFRLVGRYEFGETISFTS